MVYIRRAEVNDYEAIQKLFLEKTVYRPKSDGSMDPERLLKQRYGNNIDAAFHIDTSPFSVVGFDNNDRLIGFLSLTSAPPSFVDGSEKFDINGNRLFDEEEYSKITQINWADWIATQWEVKELQLHNTKFISFFLADVERSADFLDAALKGIFLAIPTLKCIGYFHPEGVPLFAPFSSPKFSSSSSDSTDKHTITSDSTSASKSSPRKNGDDGGKHRAIPVRPQQTGRHNKKDKNEPFFKLINKTSKGVAYSLFTCGRSEILPQFRVRKARVEDTDDLVPMLRKQHLLNDSQEDSYLADLLESTDSRTKTLVAEADSQVVGFMSFVAEYNHDALITTFDLTCFDNLQKESQAFEGESDSKKVTESEEAKKKPYDFNAFCIKHFCLEDSYANHVLDLIKHAFNHFPDRDYCVITISTRSPDIGHLTSLQSKLGKTNSPSLYIINRDTLFEQIKVRQSSLEKDFKDVQQLVSNMNCELNIMAAFKKSEVQIFSAAATNNVLETELPEVSGEFSSFVATYAGQIVGVAIMKKMSDASSFIEQYEVEDYITTAHHSLSEKYSLLAHLILNPLFENQARWFIEEVMRISTTSCIFYEADELSKIDLATSKLAKTELIPVRRRRRVKFPNNIRDGNEVQKASTHCLQLMTTSLLYEPKIAVNAKIVVVGGSDVGISFLEKLIYAPHLRFTNLVLISDVGVPEENEMFVKTASYNEEEIKQVGIYHYVHVIRGNAKDIDRVLKSVVLQNGQQISYDYLFLTPGLRFQPKALSLNMAALDGIYGVHPTDADKITSAIDLFANNFSGKKEASEVHGGYLGPKCVVYGQSVQAYTTVHVLLSRGVPAKNIVLVLPRARLPGGAFNNAHVEEVVHESLGKLGVKVYKKYKLLKWESANERINSVTIRSQEDQRTVDIQETTLFMYADEKTVDEDIFQAINDSCLVFDGLLVIDKFFRTQDQFVFAAGSVTKYSSRYQTKWCHDFYDGREVGAKMAELLLPLLDPTVVPAPLEDNEHVFTFSQAKKVDARLPGGLYYFHMDRPRLPSHSLEFRQKQQNYGRDCVQRTETTYFRIHVDPFGYIQSLTYVGERPIPVTNMQCLYGMHEKFLNRFVARFDEEGAGIQDFIRLFEEDWAMVVFHDRFSRFAKKFTAQMLSNGTPEFAELMSKMIRLASCDKPISDDQQSLLYEYFDRLPDRQDWDKRLVEFLTESSIYRSFYDE